MQYSPPICVQRTSSEIAERVLIPDRLDGASFSLINFNPVGYS